MCNNAWKEVPCNVQVVLAFWAWSDHKISYRWVFDQLNCRSNSQVFVFFVTYFPEFRLDWPEGWILSHFNYWSIFFLQVESFQINQRVQFFNNTLKASIETVKIMIFDLIFMREWKHHVNFQQLLIVGVSWTALVGVLEWESSDNCLDVIASLVLRLPLFISWHKNSDRSKQPILGNHNVQKLFICTKNLNRHNHVLLYGLFCFSQQGVEHFFLIKLVPFNNRHLKPANNFVSDQFVVIKWWLFTFENELNWVNFRWVLEHFQ